MTKWKVLKSTNPAMPAISGQSSEREKVLKIVWSGYIPAANQNQTEEYNPEEGTEEDETPSYKPSLAFIEQNYVSCVTSDEKPLADSGYDNTKESSDSDSGKSVPVVP